MLKRRVVDECDKFSLQLVSCLRLWRHMAGTIRFLADLTCASALFVMPPREQGLFNLTCVSEPYNHIERVLKALVGISSSSSLEVSTVDARAPCVMVSWRFSLAAVYRQSFQHHQGFHS